MNRTMPMGIPHLRAALPQTPASLRAETTGPELEQAPAREMSRSSPVFGCVGY